ncbi:ABC transporter ATP-binding protein [Lactobacillus sp.]|uniref:ABC transporter ATP-binding protein n=1 Tax=Lactobacillus sp. TaxID=1591 RepID=UPI003EF520D5
MIKAEKVTFSYKKRPILSEASFEIPTGQITAIVGENGSGKSTLLKLLARQLEPQSGQLFLNGQPYDAFSKKDFAQKVALMEQESRLYGDLTVEEVVAAGRLPYYSLFSNQVDQVVEEVVAELGLSELRDRSMSALSGGQKQRVWLACALVQEPELLLLDEPTNNMDLRFQEEFLTLSKKINKERGLTICLVLHDLRLAQRLADQILLVSGGQVE